MSAALFILFCAFCGCAGWVLSACHQLNQAGYAVVFAVGAIGLAFAWVRSGVRLRARLKPARVVRRFRRLFPLAFLILAALAILGGVIYAPNNYDALAYRTPRVLQWLAAEHWHWIHTVNGRLNPRGCGFEWVTAPLILFTRSDRFLFLINAVSFVLLPGRVFSLLTLLGVRNRVAWAWTWLLPTGYCYLLQAGSIANDAFGGFVALCAIEFALRARRTGRAGELWISVLAAGLMTAAKAFNLLLLLPWAVAWAPAWRLWLRRPLLSGLALVAAAGCSMAPTALLNLRYCGDWTGQAVEPLPQVGGVPAFRLAVNTYLLLQQNLTPPIFPFAKAWNDLMERVIPPGLAANLHRHFEPFAAGLKVEDLQREEGAGLGFGLSLLLLVVLGVRLSRWSRPAWSRWLKAVWRYESLVTLSGWLATGVLMAQMGMSGSARYLAPLYVLLVVPLLAGGAGMTDLVRRRWFQRASLGVFVLAGLPLVLSASRPLWPAATVLQALGGSHSTNRLVQRAWTVFAVYGERADAFAPARALLPPDANPLGVMTSDDPETSLWLPFGSRRILHVRPDDATADIQRRGIRYLLIKASMIPQYCRITADEWLANRGAVVVHRFNLQLLAHKGPTEWVLARLGGDPARVPGGDAAHAAEWLSP